MTDEVIKLCWNNKGGPVSFAPIHTKFMRRYGEGLFTYPRCGLLFAFEKDTDFSEFRHCDGIRYFLARTKIVGQTKSLLQLDLIRPDYRYREFISDPRFTQFWHDREWMQLGDWLGGTEIAPPGTVVCRYIEPFEELTPESLGIRDRLDVTLT